MNVKHNILECIGHTPIVKINHLFKESPHRFFAKVEAFNPGHSIKDRIAVQMIDDAEKSGALKAGGTIIECTSGNTGMGLAMVSVVRGYKCICVMPDKVSDEKVKALRAFGVRVVVTPTAVEPDDPRSYYSVAKRLAQEIPNSFYANQYHNPSNPKAHYHTTGPEIWEQMGKDLDVLVVATGTGGTLCGIAKYLKEKNPKIKTVCVDPIGSVFYDFFKTGKIPKVLTTYKVEGFGEDFMPSTIDFSLIDDVVQVSDQECFTFARELVQKEGIFGGGSCGGAIAGAMKFSKTLEGQKNILILLPDSGSRYLSKVYDDQWLRENGFLGPKEISGPVRELLGNRFGQVITSDRSKKVKDIVSLMKQHSISQVPVVDGGKMIGVISEVDLLTAMLQNAKAGEDNVDEHMKKKYVVIDPDESVSKLSDLFSKTSVVVVTQDERPVGVVTKIDLIEYLSGKVRA